MEPGDEASTLPHTRYTMSHRVAYYVQMFVNTHCLISNDHNNTLYVSVC